MFISLEFRDFSGNYKNKKVGIFAFLMRREEVKSFFWSVVLVEMTGCHFK